GPVDVGDDGISGPGDRDDRTGRARQLDGCGQNGVHLIGGVDSPTAEADSGQSRDLRGVAADRGRSVGGGAADAGGAEVDRADRSEERRVGKECRSGGTTNDRNKNDENGAWYKEDDKNEDS